MIGGDVVVLGGGNNGDAEGGDAEDGGADTAVRTGGKTRAWDGCVARIDVSNLSKGRHTDEDDDTAVRRRGRFGGLGSTHPERKFVLDEGNRWKTEARIAAGGTGGTAELERLRRAAQRLEENNKESGGSNSKHRLGSIDAEDEDALFQAEKQARQLHAHFLNQAVINFTNSWTYTSMFMWTILLHSFTVTLDYEGDLRKFLSPIPR